MFVVLLFRVILFTLIALSPVFAQPSSEISVLVVEGTKMLRLSSSHDFYILENGMQVAKVNAASKILIRVAPKANNDFVLVNNGRIYTLNQELEFRQNSPQADALFTIQFATYTRSYRGDLKVILDPRDSTKLMAANHIEVEDYLKSVVASEMPSSWPIEALKAQAVCARTYTYKRVLGDKFQDKPERFADLKSSVEDQMYLGYSQETESSRHAVEATRGQVLQDTQSNFIDAYYSSSAGTMTASPVDGWGLSWRPYLVPQQDYPSGSRFKSWTREFSQNKIDELLNDLRIGQILDIVIFDYAFEGRVAKLQLRGEEGSKFLTGEELRHKLGLPSTFWQLQLKDVDKHHSLGVEAPNKIFEFKGQGFGHGIGMSQYGAKNMAQDSKQYRQILQHYYPGTKLQKIGS